MRRVLMVAFHFPPMALSSGIQRTLRFVQHLPRFGWEPIVLSAHPRAYEKTDDHLLQDIPQGVLVHRAYAVDSARHLAFFGRYPRFLARPDRWLLWQWAAVHDGLRLIERLRPAALWSTFPIASAHAIGARLSRRTGLPWIADFRDPMAQEGYPADPQTWRSYQRIEEYALRHAARSVFVTRGAARVYSERYPDVPETRLAVIENGYDEESFVQAERALAATGSARSPLNPGKLTLLHSGIVYPSERDPEPLFQALGQMARSGAIDPGRLCIRFRAPVHVDLLRDLAGRYGIAELIDIASPVPYRDALAEMLRADGLLVMQGSNCDEQIPAKLYEYLRARRPILGLTTPAGDTGLALRDAGVTSIAQLESAGAIVPTLSAFLSALEDGAAPLPAPGYVKDCSRLRRSEELALLLEGLGARSARLEHSAA